MFSQPPAQFPSDEVDFNIYKQIFEHSNDAIAIIDINGYYLQQNKAHQNLVGYTDEEIIDKATPAIHFGDKAFKEIVEALTNTGAYRGEVISITKAKEKKIIDLVAYPLYGAKKQIIGYVGIKRDVTLQKKIADELKHSKKQLEIFFQNVADGITVQEPNGNLIYANQAGAEALGFNDVKELITSPPSRIMENYEVYDEHEKPLAINKLPSRLALQGKYPKPMTICFRYKKTQKKHWSIVKATPVFDSQGKVLYVVNVFTDITNHITIKKELRDSEERYRKLVNLSPLGIAIHQGGKLTFINPSCVKLIGAQSTSELIGQPILKFVHPDYHELVKKRLDEMIKTGQPADLVEQKFVRMDGSIVDVEVVSIPFLYQGTLAFQVIVRDITEQKRVLQEKEDFMAISSHELKTPLTSIKAFTQLLDRYFKQTDDEKALKYLTSMITQVDRLKNLVDDLLDVSKIQTGKLIFNEEVFIFDTVIKDIIQEVQPLTNHHKIIFENKANIRVFADKFRIGQVLTNLLTNAIKYSPNADKIIVKTTYDNNQVTLSVQDFGIGIPQNKLDKVFDRFYRVEGVKRESYPGLGLGLYISSQIMKRHNGKLWVTSKENKGSTFYFSLPITLHTRFVTENLAG